MGLLKRFFTVRRCFCSCCCSSFAGVAAAVDVCDAAATAASFVTVVAASAAVGAAAALAVVIVVIVFKLFSPLTWSPTMGGWISSFRKVSKKPDEVFMEGCASTETIQTAWISRFGTGNTKFEVVASGS